MGQIVAYRGQKVTSPFTVGIGAKTGTAITAVSTTGLTTAEANELIVKGVCSGRNSAFSAHDAATDPTTSSATGSAQTAAPIVGTWQERADNLTTTGADTALAIADAVRGTAGATGVLTCTASVSGGHAQVAGAFKIEPEPTGGVAIDAVGPSASGTTANGTSLSWSHTASGTDRLVLVGVSVGVISDTPHTISSVTYGGQAMTSVDRQETNNNVGDSGYVELFSLVNPPTGAQTIVVTKASTACDILGGSISFTGVDQTTPLVTANEVSAGGTANPISLTVTSSVGNMVVDAVCKGSALAAPTGSGMTNRILRNVNAGSGAGNLSMSTKAGAASNVLTYANSDSEFWGIIGVDVKAAPVGTVAFDAAAVSGSLSNQQSGSWNHTCSGSDRYLVVGLSGFMSGANSLSAVVVKYNNVTMTKLGGSQANGVNQAVLWGLVNPASGTNAVTFSGVVPNFPEFGGCSVSFTGVHQTTSIGTLNFSATLDNVAITLATGDMGVDIIYGGSGSTATPVAGNNVVKRAETTSTGNTKCHAMSTRTGSGSITFDWNHSDAAIAAIPIKPAPAATGITGDMAAPETVDVGAFVGSANVFGPLATTETIDVFASTGGLVRWQADLAVIETVDVLASVGTVRWNAPLATTETADVGAFVGNVARIATLATTEAVDVLAATGTVRWDTTLAAPETADTALINATVRWSATLAAPEAADAAAFLGEASWQVTLATIEAADTALINGTVIVPPTGDLATVEAPDTAALIGTTQWQATLATVEAADALAFLGVTRWAATLATTEAPDVAALVGTTKDPASGPLATTEAADTAALTGTIRWQATLAAPEAVDVAAFLGTTRWAATFATVEAPDVGAFTGVVFVPVTGPLADDRSAGCGGLHGRRAGCWHVGRARGTGHCCRGRDRTLGRDAGHYGSRGCCRLPWCNPLERYVSRD